MGALRVGVLRTCASGRTQEKLRCVVPTAGATDLWGTERRLPIMTMQGREVGDGADEGAQAGWEA